MIRALGQSELQASTDPLTGLLDRRSLEDCVFGPRRARVLEEQARSQDISRAGGREVRGRPAAPLDPRRGRRDGATREALHAATAENDVPGFTFSAGIAEATPDESFKGVLTAADEALMAAKRSGGDRVLITSSVRSGPTAAG